MTVYCRSCGAPLDEGAAQCLRCGMPIDAAVREASFNTLTGRALYNCGDCRLCHHRKSCATKRPRNAQPAE
jgi:uncharacterized membrane protein YvbJ